MILAGKVHGKLNELENIKIDLVETLPTNPVEGQIVWHVGDKKLLLFDGTDWVLISASGTVVFDDIIITGNSDFGRHVYIRDELITLNYGETGTGITQWFTTRGGIEIDRGTEPKVYLIFDEIEDLWKLSNDGVADEEIVTYHIPHQETRLHRHVNIEDEMIILNYGEDGSNITGTAGDVFQWGTNRAGIEIDRGPTNNNVSIYWDESTDTWSIIDDSGTSYDIVITGGGGGGTGDSYYLRIDNLNHPTTDISWNGYKITNLGNPTDPGDAVNKSYLDSVIAGWDWQESVIDKDLTSPPASPSDGDRYIVAANQPSGTATGDWAGHENDIATWDAVHSTWVFSTPDEGTATWTEDENVNYVYNGTSWAPFASSTYHNSLQGLQGGNGIDEFYHLTLSEYNRVHNDEYVLKSGDTMSGDLTIQKSEPRLYLNDTTDTGIDVSLGVEGEDFYIREPEDSDNEWLRITDGGWIYVFGHPLANRDNWLDQFNNATDGSNRISTSGRDLVINGKRALVGWATADGDRLDINYSGDFGNGVRIYGILDKNNTRIINTQDPVNPQDVATKHYVDSQVTSTGSNLYLRRDGSNSPTANIDWGTYSITNLNGIYGRTDSNLVTNAATGRHIDFRINNTTIAYINDDGLVGSVYNSDLAEAFECDPKYIKELPEEGTVMVINNENGKLIPSRSIDDLKYFVGIVKYDPGIFLGGDTNWDKLFKDGKIPVAIIGQVKVRIDNTIYNNQNISIGDSLTTSSNGMAIKAEDFIYSFGKVLKIIDDDYVLAIIK